MEPLIVRLGWMSAGTNNVRGTFSLEDGCDGKDQRYVSPPRLNGTKIKFQPVTFSSSRKLNPSGEVQSSSQRKHHNVTLLWNKPSNGNLEIPCRWFQKQQIDIDYTTLYMVVT